MSGTLVGYEEVTYVQTLSALWAAMWSLGWPLTLSSPVSDHNEPFLYYPSLCVT